MEFVQVTDENEKQSKGLLNLGKDVPLSKIHEALRDEDEHKKIYVSVTLEENTLQTYKAKYYRGERLSRIEYFLLGLIVAGAIGIGIAYQQKTQVLNAWKQDIQRKNQDQDAIQSAYRKQLENNVDLLQTYQELKDEHQKMSKEFIDMMTEKERDFEKRSTQYDQHMKKLDGIQDNQKELLNIKRELEALKNYLKHYKKQ